MIWCMQMIAEVPRKNLSTCRLWELKKTYYVCNPGCCVKADGKKMFRMYEFTEGMKQDDLER